MLSVGFSGLNCEFIRRKYGVPINSKILRAQVISQIRKSKSQIFADFNVADFDNKIVLLGQNSFGRKA